MTRDPLAAPHRHDDGPARLRGTGRLAHNLTGRPLLRRWLLWAAIAVGFLLGGLLLSVAIGLEIGGQAALYAVLVAIVPVGIVVPAFLWLDRFEAEPPRYLLFAFFWGALIATAVSLVLNTGSTLLLETSSPDAENIAAVMVAPVVEESLKGLGVLLILWFRRREFDGVIDGVVYAGLSAAGFAFAENILYLGRAFDEAGAGGLAATFVVRGLLSPFAHPLFTMWTGVGIGIAATRSRGVLRFLAPVAGLLLAMGLHALWNLSAVAGLDGFTASYLLFQVPIFIGAICFVLWERRREARLIARYLSVYIPYGWLSPVDVSMLSGMQSRRRAREWAAQTGGKPRRRAMIAFQDDASELALLRARMVRGTAGPDAGEQERALLDSLTRVRAVWLPPSPKM